MTYDVVSIGEALIDFIALDKLTSIGATQNFRRAAGGGPANVAVGSARLGLQVAFIGKVGQDPFGEHLREVLTKDGIDVSGLILDASVNTTLAFVALRDTVPEFFFFRQKTGDTALTLEEIPTDIVRSARLFHFSSVSLTVEPCRTAVLGAVRMAKAAGAVITFDPNIRLSLWPDETTARKEILAACDMADIVKMNTDEFRFLLGLGEEDIKQGAQRFLDNGARLVVVTLGPTGAVMVSREGVLPIPALPVDVVDTTGAGDAFMSGILSVCSEAMGRGDELKKIDMLRMETLGRWGNATAALACTQVGGIPSLPERNRVMNLLMSM